VAQGTEVRSKVFNLGVKFGAARDVGGFYVAAIFALAPAHVGGTLLNVTHGANLTAPRAVSNFYFHRLKIVC